MGSLSSTLRVSVLGATLTGVLLAPGVALADGPGYGGTANALTVQWRIRIGTSAGGLAVYAVGFRAGSKVRLRVGATTERVVITDSCGALRVLVVPGTAPRAVPTPRVPTRTVPTPRVVPSRTVPTPRVVPSRTAVSRSVVSNAFVLRPVARPAVSPPVATPPTDTTVLNVPDEAISRLSTGTSVLVVGETPTGALRTLVGAVPPPEAGWGAQDLAPWAGAATLIGAFLLWTRRRSATAVGAVRRYRRPARHRA